MNQSHSNPPKRGGFFWDSLLTAIGQVLLLSAAILPAWRFGGVLARDQVWLYPALLGAWGCWCLGQLLHLSRPLVLPAASGILLAILGLGGLQLLPLGPQIARFVSPATVGLRAELVSPAESPPQSPQAIAAAAAPPAAVGQTLSLDPASTRRDLAFFSLVALMFVLGGLLFSGTVSRVGLCAVVAVQGAAVAFFSLAQTLRWHPEPLQRNWRLAFTSDCWFGPFVNRNHEGGYLNLCLAGAIGLLVLTIERSADRREACRLQAGSGPQRPVALLLRPLANLSAALLFASGLAGCMVAAILCSLSRSASVSMGAGLILLLLADFRLRRRRRMRLWPLVLAAVAGIGLVSWIGARDSVSRRLGSLFESGAWQEGRLYHWRDAVQAAGDFWPAGSGLGTYPWIYQAYQHRADVYWYQHAENQYLEALVVAGAPGVLLLFCALGVTLWAVWRALANSRRAAELAFAVAACFALVTQSVQSLFDFGLYLPANALLLALFCGAVSAGATHAPGRLPAWLRTTAGAILLLIFGGLVTWGWGETRRVAALAAATNVAARPLAAEQPTRDEAVRALEQFSAAVALRPDDADAQFYLAQLWLQVYRAAEFAELRGRYPAAPAEKLNELTKLASLYLLRQQLHQAGDTAGLARLRSDPLVQANLVPAQQHALLARQACPLIPQIHVLLAELSVIDADGNATLHLQRAERLAPSNTELLNKCATLELWAGHVPEACRIWKRALAIEEYHVGEALLVCEKAGLTPQQIVEDVLPDSPLLLVKLAQERFRAEKQPRVYELLVKRAAQLLDQAPLAAAQREYLRATLQAMGKQYDEAIASYNRALSLRPREVAWRFELAKLLFERGKLEEALDQARLCVRMDPAQPPYQQLLEAIYDRRLRDDQGIPVISPRP